MVREVGKLGFLAVVLMLGVFLLTCCGDDDGGGTTAPGDTTPPAAVTDLVADAVSSTEVRLVWTAPGDDGMSGRASQYDIRYSTTPLTEEGWSTASLVATPPVPKVAGGTEEFTVGGLQSGTPYYLGLKAADEVPNWSGMSNVALATTPSGQNPGGMVLIQPGTFTMGSPGDEPGRRFDETQHQVTLTVAFYISDHEVTQAEWEAVMGWNGSFFSGDSRPVEMVTWFDCIDFCNKKSQVEGFTPAYTLTDVSYDGDHITSATVSWNQSANGYRLPTEAEWEYACRAGSTTAFCNGAIIELDCEIDPNLAQVGWYCGNANSQTRDVMGKNPNAWNLFDMHGNVSEWCWDWHGSYSGPETDPTGPASGSERVLRGGCWTLRAENARSATRGFDDPSHPFHGNGLRLSRAAP